MGMLYMMTRFKGAEKVTTDFEAVMQKAEELSSVRKG